MTYDAASYEELNIEKLSEIWEPRKEYIEKDLWVIRNFLSKEELDFLNKEANDPNDWYTTMRSPYGGNIKNKFIGYVVEYDENGNFLVPNPQSEYRQNIHLDRIDQRLTSVLPKYMTGARAFQSFFEVPEEQIIAELGYSADYAMGYHYERDDHDDDEKQRTVVSESKTQNKKILSEGYITASFSVYVNDNFDGGVLKFRNKDYEIKPEPGMLINIPLYKEFEHMITKVTNGNRHSLYGRCWSTVEDAYRSTNEDC